MTPTALDLGQLLGLDRSGCSAAQWQAEVLAVRRHVQRLPGVDARLLAELAVQAAVEPTGGMVLQDRPWVTVAGWLPGPERGQVDTTAAQVAAGGTP